MLADPCKARFGPRSRTLHLLKHLAISYLLLRTSPVVLLPLVHVALFKMTISDLELSLIAHFWQAHHLHLMVATASFRTASPGPHEPYHVLRFPPGSPE
jgi:hypothetical protein